VCGNGQTDGRGAPAAPEGLLKVGDVVRIEIDGIGELENTAADEPEGYILPEAEPLGEDRAPRSPVRDQPAV
jgi:protein involved in polysaccharide export with SLBB domain